MPVHSLTDPVTPDAARRAVRALVPRIADRAQEYDRTGDFPVADFDDLRARGLLGLMVPVDLGGCGATFSDYTEIAMELAEGSGSTALIFNMHASVTGALAQLSEEVLSAFGARREFFDERDRLLAEAATGALYAVAMSERGSGSRLSKTTTSYRRTARGFRITGSKTFVSGAEHADAFLVTAREADAVEPNISYFLVPAGPGARVERTWDAMGLSGLRAPETMNRTRPCSSRYETRSRRPVSGPA